MIIQHNLAAMNANRMYLGTSRKQTKRSERLSSGYRINRAADDAAGLAISEKMRRQIRGLSQAVNNAQDGISMVQIADGAMAEVQDMLHRGTELSVKAANGTLQDEDRSYIQREIAQIKEEIDKISDRTTFNKIWVLKGKDVPKPEGNTEVIIAGGLPTWVKLGSTTGVMSEVYTTTQNYESTTTDPNDGSTTTTQGQENIDHEAATLDFSKFTGSAAQLKELENNGFHTTCCTCTNHYSVKFTMGTTSSMEQSGSHYIYNVGIGDVKDADELLNRIVKAMDNGYPQSHYTKLAVDTASKKLIIYDDRSRDTDPIPSAADTTITWSGWSNPYFDTRAGGDYGKFAPGTAYSKDDVDKLAKVDLVILQVGTEMGHEIGIELPSISASSLKIQDVDLSTQSGAKEAIAAFEKALKYVSEERSRMGAYQNRLEHTINNLNNVIENTQASESAIRDTDMAQLMVEYANGNILAQAGMAMLSQANMKNEGVLALLR
ncbi:MAG: hypothetical protein HDR02_13010 [Lachnospiraceae bacterium]|nr:hypothetical protein [Lachnospiraceae bacterium]